MTKIILNGAQDVPLNKLILSQANVRRIKAGVSIDDLAEDIARRGLLQSLSVRPVLDGEGQDTGIYEVPAGGRRFAALQLLAKQKRLSKTVRVPCIVRTDGIAEEDSLAENTMREALHPLDQFRAFQMLREHGLGDEEIAARFFVTPAVVRQRLKLAAASPKLLDLYAAGELALEQLMAFLRLGRPCAPGAGFRKPGSQPQPGALCDSPAPDRARRQGERQEGGVRRGSRVRGGWRRCRARPVPAGSGRLV